MEHTPTPWGFERSGPGTIEITATQEGHAHLSCIAEVLGPVELNAEANADFIVRACNAHEDLLEALRGYESLLAECWDELPGLVSGGPDAVNAVADVGRAAIAKAEGEDQ